MRLFFYFPHVLAAMLVCLMMVSTDVKAQNIYLVDAALSGNQNAVGHSSVNVSDWAGACGDLQTVIDAASDGDEIWVKTGTYHPTRDPFGSANPADAKDKTFYLKSGVKLYGGFSGSETVAASRNSRINTTVLSGYLGMLGSEAVHSYHVVLSVNDAATTVLDGFTVTAGKANGAGSITVESRAINKGAGGGIANESGSLQVINSVITGNTGVYGGGLMLTSVTASAVILNTVISNNNSYDGGGVICSGSSAVFVNCVLSGNTATHDGGGIHIFEGEPKFRNITVAGNTAPNGGGMNINSSPVSLVNSIVWGNSGTTAGLNVSGSADTVTYCILQESYTGFGNIHADPLFRDASAGDYTLLGCSPAIDAGFDALVHGGITKDLNGNDRLRRGAVDMGAYEFGFPVAAVGSNGIIYVKNGCSGSGSSWADATSDLQAAIDAPGVSEVRVAGGNYKPMRRADALGSITVNDRENAFVLKKDIKIVGGYAGSGAMPDERNLAVHKSVLDGDLGEPGSSRDNAYHVVIGIGDLGNALIDGFVITGGNADELGASSVTVNGQGVGHHSGGGLSVYFGTIKLRNVSVEGNSAYYEGGGMYVTLGRAEFLNSTVTGNSASSGGGVFSFNSLVKLTLSTVAGNTNYGIVLRNASFEAYSSIVHGNGSGGVDGTGSFTSSLLQGLSDTSNGNISGEVDPRFVEPVSHTEAPKSGGDYRLQGCSPVINKGETYLLSDVATDLGGRPRVFEDVQVDMGAYEFQGEPILPPSLPVTNSPQILPVGSLVENLVVTGENIKWYEAPTGGRALGADVVLAEKTYYVSQTVNTCESTRVPVEVASAYRTRYVTPTGSGDGSSWLNASGDLQAMINTAGVRNVLVGQGTFKPNRRADATGTVSPGDRNNAFVLKKDVSVSGGYVGTGSKPDERDPVLYKSVLSGDLGVADVRSDNAYHVVISAGDVGSAQLDGLVITGGQAESSGEIEVNGLAIHTHKGGGVYLAASSPALFNLVIQGNQASSEGGGIFVDNTSVALTNLQLTGNKATDGGGIFGTESSSLRIVNNTISGNTSYGVVYAGSGLVVHNSIISGNGEGGIYGALSDFKHSLIQGQTSKENSNIHGDADPRFAEAPSYTTAPFIGGDFGLTVCSPVIDKGNNTYPNQVFDLAGKPRIYNEGTVDMGALEFQGMPLFTGLASDSVRTVEFGTTIEQLIPSGRLLNWYKDASGGEPLADTVVVTNGFYYVSERADGCETERTKVRVSLSYSIRYVTATGTGDGSSWAHPSSDLQAMIDAPAVVQVRVAGGVYKPVRRADSLATITPDNRNNAFVLKYGVKLYGGFSGTGSTPNDRDLSTHVSVLSGDLGEEGNSDDNAYHVVIGSGNVDSAVLDGFTISGGNASGSGNANLASDGIMVNGQMVSRKAGGGLALYFSKPRLANLVISGNQASSEGGGAYFTFSPVTVSNSRVSGNKAPTGGGIYNFVSDGCKFLNVTMSGNSDFAVVNVLGNPWIANSIIYGNELGGVTGGYPAYSNSLVQGYTDSWNWSTNLPGDYDPLFTSAPVYSGLPFTSGNYTLSPCSPAVNAGENDMATQMGQDISIDLAGKPRIYNDGRIDMGAYEVQEVQPPGALPPTLDSIHIVSAGATIGDLVADGTNLRWYDTSHGGVALATDAVLREGFYYVTQQPQTCESRRKGILVGFDLPVRYVRATSTGTGTGSDWDNASDDLQRMIDIPGVTQVWVASGEYKPIRRADDTGIISVNDRRNAFVLKKDVTVYGGFDGTETALNQRKMGDWISVLSGNLGNDRIADDNSYHVVISVGDVGTGGLDGFIISDGHANEETQGLMVKGQVISQGRGGGLYLSVSSPVLANLIVRGNRAMPEGGGIYLLVSPVTMINTVVSGNSAQRGGGIYSNQSTPVKLANVTVAGNTHFGMVQNSPFELSLAVVNSVIHGNESGGVLSEEGAGAPTYSYSFVQGLSNTSNGNIDGGNPPMFVDAIQVVEAPTIRGDYRLQVCSPGINAGNSALVPDGLSRDVFGIPRIAGNTVDMGAYEFEGALSGANLLAIYGSDTATIAPNQTLVYTDEDARCLTIAKVHATGLHPVSGIVSVSVRVEGEMPEHEGVHYVKRCYEIYPYGNPETATARLTLFFTQAEFDEFNLVSASGALPDSADDASGKRRLRVYQYHGPISIRDDISEYIFGRTVIAPGENNIVWNPTLERWEVSFDVEGFSVFMIGSESSPLPVKLVSFTGRPVERGAVALEWVVSEQKDISGYAIEYSSDGRLFREAGRVAARNDIPMSYQFIDTERSKGEFVYYRLRILELSGEDTYSRIISVRLPVVETLKVYPVPALHNIWIQGAGLSGSEVRLTDWQGRILRRLRMRSDRQQIDISSIEPGVYMFITEKGVALKFLKE